MTNFVLGCSIMLNVILIIGFAEHLKDDDTSTKKE